ncbi:MAG: M20/M25/M40 family metallo-hydrolase, partial [Actinobacteria bacterium]|nr:M20/M25/M40 family metallo-hydrolase [Actinomycetota bacterium]
EVEEGRANVLGTWAGAGGGPTLMFNGHMDTSYSGAEPWLRGIPGFRPEGFEEDGYIYGLGVANMKGALCCYLEALRALQDAGVRLRGDLLIAAVAGEIEKTQYGDEFRGRLYRGYSAGSRHLVQHGGVADICILGEPTEHKIVLAHFGAMWARISTHGPFIHTAFSRERQQENSIRRMQDVIAAVDRFIPEWEAEMQHEGVPAMANIGAVQGGMAWRASRTPRQTDLFLDLRVPPRVPMATARRRFLDFVRELAERHPEHDIDGEVYLTAPGAEVGEGDVVVAAVDAAHKVVNGREPERDIVHWYSDASALTRYGIQTVNYGTASGLPSAEKGENVEIDGLINVTKVYALAAAQLCGVDR